MSEQDRGHKVGNVLQGNEPTEREKQQAQINLNLFQSLQKTISDKCAKEGFNKEKVIAMLRHREYRVANSRSLRNDRDRLENSFNLLKEFASRGVISESQWQELRKQYDHIKTIFLDPLREAIRETELSAPTKPHVRGTSGRYRGSKGGS